MTTLVAGDSVRGFVAGGRACRRGYSIDDRRTILVEFHARNEPDQLTAVLPVKAVESIADLIRELAQPTNHGGQLDSLPESRFSVIEFLARPLDAGANAIASRHEVFKIDRARLVRIPQAAERVLLGHEQPLGLIPLRAQLRDCPVLSSALRPFLEHTRRIFHHVKIGLLKTDSNHCGGEAGVRLEGAYLLGSQRSSRSTSRSDERKPSTCASVWPAVSETRSRLDPLGTVGGRMARTK
jgi:hypothetical protein